MAVRVVLVTLLCAPMLMTSGVSGARAYSHGVSLHAESTVPRGLAEPALSAERAASLTRTRLLLSEASGSSFNPCANPKACSKPPDHILFMYEVHGWLMALAWGVLAPAAIVLAYNFRNVGPSCMWFQAHRAIMLVAYLAQLAGVGVVIAPMLEYWEFYSRQVMIHISVGIVLEILAGGQVLAAMVKRPNKVSRYRRAWTVAHLWTGRFLLILGIALIFDGLLLYHSGKPYQHLFILLSAILFFFFAVAAGKDAYDQLPLPPPAVTEAAAAAAAAKLQKIEMQQRRGNDIEPMDSARVSPTTSKEKLVDGLTLNLNPKP